MQREHDRLETLAGTVAATHHVEAGRRWGSPILRRLRQNRRALLSVWRTLQAAVRAGEPMTPAAEWFLDNFPIVEEQLRQIEDDLPAGYYRRLPKLRDSHLAGLPRVHALALAFTAATEGVVTLDTLRRFVDAYQEVAPLTLGEIWAIPISIRLVLVEDVRRLADEIAVRRQDRLHADALADTLLGPKGAGGAPLNRALAVAGMRPAFVAQLVQRLRDSNPSVTPGMEALNEMLAQDGLTADEVVRRDHVSQVAMVTPIRNAITSMRTASTVDWREFVEAVSHVHQLLLVGTNFGDLEFASRDRYRHAVEDLAEGSGRGEGMVARHVANKVRQYAGPDPRAGDLGHHLIAGGRRALEEEIGYRPRLLQRIRRIALSAPALTYVSAVVAVSVALLAIPAHLAARGGSPWPLILLFCALCVIQASDVSVALVNRLVTAVVGPRRLPRLAMKEGVPPEFRTLVAVPVMLSTEADVEEAVARLEVHALATGEAEVAYALLSDGRDAAQPSAAADDALVALARAGIARLNERYPGGPGGGPRFYLFHRRRVWNPAEGVWMGWERKRGKLRELNRLLRGAADTTFLPEHDPAAIAARAFRFVLSLDIDTHLPPDAARLLIGTLAHPLNRPVHDPTTGIVVQGYGILQPRVTPSLPDHGRWTLIQRIVGGTAGVDPYAYVVSDVYQDLLGEGIYIGKGLYDVDAFETALDGRVGENELLSHDLFEGLYARAGFVADVDLFEETPGHHGVHVARQHRWARGDWQLLPWIFARTPIPLIGRWKLLDNLRRSLGAPTAILVLLAAWGLAGDASWVWTGFVLVSLAVPSVLPVLFDLVPRRVGLAKRALVRRVLTDFVLGFGRALLAATFLAAQAAQMTDAILRTLFRLTVSRRFLLQWQPAAAVGACLGTGIGDFYRSMWPVVPIALSGALIVVLRAPATTGIGLALCFAWLVSPVFAWWISVPAEDGGRSQLSRADLDLLRRTARDTWGWFETFVTPEDRFLPPDNTQHDAGAIIAHRTSPTNIGLYLLACCVAHERGWIGTGELASRVAATLDTMGRMERYRGHLFNWYETTSLRALAPRYVSTVDSGNLVGHLWAVEQALRAVAARRSGGNPRAGESLREACDDLEAALGAVPPSADVAGATAVEFLALAREVKELIPASFETIREEDLAALTDRATALVDLAGATEHQRLAAPWDGIVLHARRLAGTLRAHLDDRRGPAMDERLRELASIAAEMAKAVDFGFLYREEKGLFSIGFNVEENRLDEASYDLLASEARLASFVAVAEGQVPLTHWFHLGRRLVPVGAGSGLVSWSGSMFEYLMPELVMAPPAWSLLDRTERVVVRRQIEYGRDRGVPWGISEAAYNRRDIHMTYQYSNFGVSGLGLKRGLADDLVVAPYATALAAMVDPRAATKNLRALEAAGARGRFGFFESIDYTRARLPDGAQNAVVRAYMAHHQAMSLVAIGNVLSDFAVRRWFHAAPMVQAAELLLHERAPRLEYVSRTLSEEAGLHLHVQDPVPPVLRHFTSPHDLIPPTQRLSNGRYSVLVTTAGAGASVWDGLAVTRWREDETTDRWGAFIYLRDTASGAVWSSGHQPTAAAADEYSVSFYEHRVEILRVDGTITTTTEIVVSPEDDAELRRVTLRNTGTRPRTIELTSYAEVVLAPPAADAAHPAFSKLFVQTEFDPRHGALIAVRRTRSVTDPPAFAAHASTVVGVAAAGIEFETDRARFLGRGGDVRRPAAVMGGRPLSDTAGSVLDPVFSLRRRVTIGPGETARVCFLTVASHRRDTLEAALARLGAADAFDRVVASAWTHAQVQLHHHGISAEEAHLYQHLASRVLYADPLLRGPDEVMRRNHRGQRSLWRFGISGDQPILLAEVEDVADRDLVRQLVRAQDYWRIKGFVADLVILNNEPHSYGEELEKSIDAVLQMRQYAGVPASGGRIHVLRGKDLSQDDGDLLRATARVVFRSEEGPLADQVLRLVRSSVGQPPRLVTVPDPPAPDRPLPRFALEFSNGIGGFDAERNEYVIVLPAHQWTPVPWVNVCANPTFGCVITEAGAGYTWAENSHENQLTPWSNDPVSDPVGDTIYLRDEETGNAWTPTPLPMRDAAPYVVQHGQGYTTFDHEVHEIETSLTVFVAPDAPVRLSRLVLRNRSSRPRVIQVVAYVEWVLGANRAVNAPYIVTALDEETGAFFVRNPWNEEFKGRVAFAEFVGLPMACSGDRAEFIGRNGTLAAPAGLSRRAPATSRLGPGLDPCGVLRTSITLGAHESREVVFLLGQGVDEAAARALIRLYRTRPASDVLEEVRASWSEVLSAVEVRTPDRAMDLMLNRWALYQVLSCRIWARAGFYQAGGAFGFRDQLQDMMALAAVRPDLTREHLLRAARHQFQEGDVQHWWHPPGRRGVRTRFTDDRLWLAWCTEQYLGVTGDLAVLEERVPFVDAPPLQPEQEDAYLDPAVSGEEATLYEHVARAIDVSLAVGRHGLPLIGGGDWNDGLNRVGLGGEGESVWLAWFLIAVLDRWHPVARARGDADRAQRWLETSDRLRVAVEAEGWDGEWYRRAYMDDGSAIGSAANVECRIDSLAQSWAVLSGAARPDRARRALASVEEHLLRRADSLVLLLTPPFDRTALDPGYIRGYLPGIRENGGQYTHAGAWVAMAFAALRDGNKAAEIFSMLNPIHRTSSRAGVHRYKAEPYVFAADVYGAPPHVGRAGWTWYTGSAAWMYRLGLESILGIKLRAGAIELAPCIPSAWPSYSVRVRWQGATYVITVTNPDGVQSGIVRLGMDGVELDPVAARVPLANDGQVHEIGVTLG